MAVLKICSNGVCSAKFTTEDGDPEHLCPKCRSAATAARSAWENDPKMVPAPTALITTPGIEVTPTPRMFQPVMVDGVPHCPTCDHPLRPMTSTERARKSRKLKKIIQNWQE
jgi:hypothetical protein